MSRLDELLKRRIDDDLEEEEEKKEEKTSSRLDNLIKQHNEGKSETQEEPKEESQGQSRLDKLLGVKNDNSQGKVEDNEFTLKGKEGWQKYLDDIAKAEQEAAEAKENRSWWDKVSEIIIGGFTAGAYAGDTTLPMGGVGTTINALREDESYRKPNDNWTEKQQIEFGNLYMESPAKAFTYAEKTNAENNRKAEEDALKKIAEDATSSFGAGAGHTIGAIATAPFGMVDALYDLEMYAAGRPIAPDGTVTPFEYSQAVKSGISEHLNEEGGVINESVPILGGKGWGDVYGLGVSTAESALSGLALGSTGTLVSYFGQGMASGIDEAKALGASDEQAVTYGLILGLGEGVAESIGVDKLFGIGASSTFKELMLNVLKQAGAEGLEEGLTSVIGNVADAWVLQDKGNLQTAVNAYMSQGMTEEEAKKQVFLDSLEGIAYDMLGGAVSGGVHAGGATTIQSGISNYNASKVYGNKSQMLIDEALAVENNTKLHELAQSLQDKRTSKGKNLTGGQINQLLEASDTAKLKNAVLNRLGELGETSDVTPIADVLVRRAMGEKLSSRDASILNNSKAGHIVLAEINEDNIKSGGLGNKWAENVGTRKINPEAYNKNFVDAMEMVKKVYRKDEEDAVNAEMSKAQESMPGKVTVSESGKTVYNDENGNSHDVNIKGIVSTDNGELKVELDNGKTVSTKSLSFSSHEEGLMYEMVARMETSPETANELIKTLKPSNASQAAQYFTAIPLAYKYGTINYEAGLKNIHISDKVKKLAFNRGKMDATINAKTNRGVANGKTTKKGGIIFEGDYVYDESKANEMQKVSMAHIEVIDKMSNLETHIFESKVIKGKRVAFIDGKWRSAPNGYFKDGNKIYIDINAGNAAEGAMLYTMSHEIGHYIREWNAKGFKELGDFLISEYGKMGVSVTALIEAKKKKIVEGYKEDNKALPSEAKLFDMAYEEVVADAMSEMLADPKAYEKLAKLKQKNRTLWEKVGEAIKALLDKLKDSLGIYKTKKPSVAKEAYLARGFSADAYNKLQDLYLKAFVEADANYEASIGTRNLKDFADAKNENGEPLFQYRAMEADESAYREMLHKWGKMSGEQIDNLFATIDNAMELIKDNLEALDYAWEADIDDRAFSPIKPNSDKLYQVSLDFSTLCRKRILQQTVQAQLQEALNKPLSREEGIAIRDALIALQEEGRQIEVACALCYVESARMKSPEQIKKFMNNREKVIKEFFAGKSGGNIKAKIKQAEVDAKEQLHRENPNGIKGKDGKTMLDPRTASLKEMPKKYADVIRDAKRKAKASYKPTAKEQNLIEVAKGMSVSDFTSPEGLENLAKNYPDLFDAYTSYVRNATKSKGIESDTWWRAGDSSKIGDVLIANMNRENGLRSQSWSDFQVIHILDYIASTIELATRNTKEQAYSKVPDYVELMGLTGVMINMSLIPTATFNGSLEYDSVEGIDYKRALELRDKYPKTAGTICIGVDNVQIKFLLADTTIDYVIPYHKSGMSKAIRKLMHIPTWSQYEEYQSEKNLSRADAEKQAKKYGVKLLDASDPNYQKGTSFSEWFDIKEAQEIAKKENASPSDKAKQKQYGVMYGGYMAMQNAANNYLKLCAERGLSPKFSHEKADFTTEANYWKLLIDRKMVNNITGEVIEQETIKPIFSETEVMRILNDELARYPKVKEDQDYAIRRVTEKMLSGEIKGGMSAEAIAKVMKKPVDNVTNVNILASAEDVSGEDIRYSFRDSENGMANDALSPYGEELAHLIEQRGDYIVDSFDKLKHIVNLAFDNTNLKATAYFGILNTETLVKIKNSIPNLPKAMEGILFKQGREYSIATTFDSIRHLADEKNLSREDAIDYLDRFADTVIEFDSVAFDFYIKGNNRTPGLLFKKAFSDGIVYNFDLVSNKKKSLTMHSLYLDSVSYQKKKSAKTLPMQNASGNTSKTQVSQTSVNSISEGADFVNREFSDDDTKYSERDSDGNELSAEQQEFFRDSKVRDEKGNLLVCTHNSPSKFTVFDKSKIGDELKLGKGFYFYIKTKDFRISPQFGTNQYEVYLNIKNPFDYNSSNKEYILNMLEKSGYSYDKQLMESYEENNFKDDDLLELLSDAIPNHYVFDVFDKMLINAGFDGIWADNEIVAFSPEQIKETSNKTPTSNPDIRYSERDSYAPTFYSHMSSVIDGIKLEKMGANGVVSYLKGKGVKDEEIKWSGIEAFLEGKKSVTKAELQEFVAGSQLQIVEQMSDNEEYTHWSEYKLDGGSNYRELVFQLPNSTYSNRAMRVHWGEDAEGVLVHARIQDFDVNGKKMLFVEELQSDWHNEGREKGYTTKEYEDALEVYNKLAEDYANKRRAFNKYVRSGEFRSDPDDVSKKKFDWLRMKMETAEKRMQDAERDIDALKAKGMGDVPDAPFRNNYHEYVLKRLLRMAAEEGYDSIGWTPADIQSKRWSEDYAEAYRIEYDQEMPKFLRKYGKKWGATVGKTSINDTEVWSMDITDSMTESVLYEGQVLYSERVTDQETLAFLENQEHITTYKSFVVIDGKLYSPMASKVKGEDGKYHLTNPSEIGVWQQAEEKPDSIPKFHKTKGYGYYVLKKDDGGSITAAYNPYEHSSNLVLNDQFEAAYQRPNLVTVECIIPKSEMTSGYKAKYAKDSVGYLDWKSGTVAGKLKGNKRKVYLSRWLKPVRILSDAEVASMYKDILGSKISVPFNVVTPQLLTELEKVGVKIDYDGSQGYQYRQSKKVANGDTKFSERDTDAISDRTLLANALESVAKSEIEKTKLAQYKQKIALIESEQKKLAEIKAKANELRFTKGRTPSETKAMRDLDFEANQIANRINTYDKQLLNLESTTALKNVLEREKAQLRRRLEQKGKEAIKRQKEKDAKTIRELMTRHTESRKKAIEGRNKTEMRHSILKLLKRLNKLFKGGKERNVKEGMKETVATALALGEILFNNDITNKDIVNLGVESVTERESKFLNEYRDILMKKEANEDRIKSLREGGDLASVYSYISELEAQNRKYDRRIAELNKELSDVFIRERARLNRTPVSALIDKLALEYQSLKESKDDYIKRAYEPELFNKLIDLKSKLGGVIAKDMSMYQLETVHHVFTMIEHSVRTANQYFRNGKFEDLQTSASAIMEEIERLKDAKQISPEMAAQVKSYIWNELTPYFAFDKIGSETLMTYFEDLMVGQRTYAKDSNEAKLFAEETRKKHNYSKWKLDEMYNFKLKDGRTFSTTLKHLLSVYAYSKREQALDHMSVGGFFHNDKATFRKEKGILKMVRTDAVGYKIDADILAEITKALGKEKTDYVDEMLGYLTAMGEKGNEVTRIMWGVDIFKEKIYFPLKSKEDFLKKSTETAQAVSLKNDGMTKETMPGASNPIVLEAFDDVWANHVDRMSLYHGFVIPIDNLNKVLHYGTWAGTESMSVSTMLEGKFTSAATDYLEQFINDLNGGVANNGVSNPFANFFSKFKKTAVGASMSTVVQQPTAIIRAMAEIDAKYFVGKPNLSRLSKQWEELKTYSPIAIIKEIGGFDAGGGKQTARWINTSSLTGIDKVANTIDDLSMKGAEIADQIGWLTIWEAVKRETKATTDLAVGSKEFLDKCGERFEEIITKTQVYDSTLSRSAFMRSKNDGVKMLTAFMGEPTLSINMLYNAVLNAKRGGKGAKLKATKTIGCVYASMVFASALASAIYALRDDDEDESYLEKWAEKFGGEVISDIVFAPLTSLPGVKDIVSVFEGWDVERSDMAIFKDIKDAFDGLGSENKSTYRKIEDFAGAIASAFGLPLKNVLRTGREIYNAVNDMFDGVEGGNLGDAFLEGVTGKETDKGKKLYDAIINRDNARLEIYKKDYKTKDSYETAVRKALRENDSRIHEAAQARYDGNISEYSRIVKSIVAEGHFSQDTVVGAVNAELSAIKKGESTEKEPSKDKDEATSIYSASDLNGAFDNGDTYTAHQIIDDLIRTKVANGMTEKEAKSSLRSSMTSYWKPLYKKAYQSGNNSEMARIRQILYSSGLYGTANDVVKDTQSWLKN